MPANPYLSGRDSDTLEDPLIGFNFLLELEGAAAGYFTECNGIEAALCLLGEISAALNGEGA